jgi:hypothetical protein
MTSKEIFNLEEGTLVKIKSNVKCDKSFKKPCKLTFNNYKQDHKDYSGGYEYGILTFSEDLNGVCYDFHSSDYELAE